MLDLEVNFRGNPVVIANNISQMYSKDVDFENAVIQLEMLADIVKSYKQSKGLRILEVTSMWTISGILNEELMANGSVLWGGQTSSYLFHNIPVTEATAERSFYHLRSSITEKMLNNVIFLHSYKEETDHLVLREIASIFGSKKERRLTFWGSFT